MTEIIINDLTPRVQYTAAAAQTVFTYNYPIFDEADVSVYKTPVGQAPDDALDKLMLSTHYTVQGVGQATGGTITLLAGATNGDIITIERNMALNRTSDYNDAGSFKAQTVNRDFDREVMMVQQVSAKIEKRGLLYQHSDAIPPGMNILPKLLANQLWKANPSGTGIMAATYEEDPGANTLRSELAEKTANYSGAELVGYYDNDFGLGGITIAAYLAGLLANHKDYFDTLYPNFTLFEGVIDLTGHIKLPITTFTGMKRLIFQWGSGTVLPGQSSVTVDLSTPFLELGLNALASGNGITFNGLDKVNLLLPSPVAESTPVNYLAWGV